MAQMASASWLYGDAREGDAIGSQGYVQAQGDTHPLPVRQARYLALSLDALMASARLDETIRQLFLKLK